MARTFIIRTLAIGVVALMPLLAHAGNTYPDGQVDTSFAATASSPGWRRSFISGTLDEQGIAMARTANGSYIVLVSVPGGAVGSRIGLIKYTADGGPVSSGFGTGTDGKVVKDAYLIQLKGLLIDSAGRIVVIGTTPGPGGVSDFGVVRFNADGSDDNSFAGDGGIAVGFDSIQLGTTTTDSPVAVIEQIVAGVPRLVVAGNHRSTSPGAAALFGMVGIANNGSVDTSFGNIGSPADLIGRTTGRFYGSQDAYAAALVQTATGTLVLAGTTVLSATDTDFAACRFGPSGIGNVSATSCVSIAADEPGPGGSIYDTATAAVVSSRSQVTLVGTASGKIAATRIVVRNGEPYLQIDPSFVGSANINRPSVFVTATANTYANDVVPRTDGTTLIAGRYTPGGLQYGAVLRLRADGSADPVFGPQGLYYYVAPTLDFGESYSTEFNKILIDAGRPVLFGSSPDSTTALTDFDGVLMRLNSDLIFRDGLQ